MPCYRREPAERGYAARNPQVARPSVWLHGVPRTARPGGCGSTFIVNRNDFDRCDCPGLHEHSAASDEVPPATHDFPPSTTGAKDSHSFTNGEPSQRPSGPNAAPSRSFTLRRALIKKPTILGVEVSGNNHPQQSPSRGNNG